MIASRVQADAFDPGAEAAAVHAGRSDIGGIVCFTGLVRADAGLVALTIEHYPAMTTRQLAAIAAEAQARWPVLAGTIIHRHGRLLPGEPIVFVGIAAAHRGPAFAAAEFLMDWLKTRAPFWKHEEGPGGARWVAARASDDSAAARWQQP